jgi:hypothetical protein
MWKKGETLRWTQIEEIDHPDFPVMIRVEKSGGLYARVPLSFFQAEDKKMDYFVECTRALESLIEPVY